MTPERWKRISGVFAEALALDPDARPAFLEVACREHPEDLSLIGQLLSRDLAQPHLLEGRELLAPLQAPTPPGTLVGRRLGAYEVIAEIGRGGMGVVYLATDTRLGRLVALKALPVALAGDPARRERLRHEARAAAALSHPNIAAIHALEETDDAVYLVSEFVRGRSLRQALDGSPLPAPEAMAVLRGVAEALAAAHAAGIVHRDLKPENVLLTESGGVKLVDFGLARFLRPPGDDQTRSQLTRSGMVLGTPGYMAPEQVRGEPVDARADVFAWGALAFEVVTGEPAFGARAATAALARILEAEVDLSPVRARLPRPRAGDRSMPAESAIGTLPVGVGDRLGVDCGRSPGNASAGPRRRARSGRGAGPAAVVAHPPGQRGGDVRGGAVAGVDRAHPRAVGARGVLRRARRGGGRRVAAVEPLVSLDLPPSGAGRAATALASPRALRRCRLLAGPRRRGLGGLLRVDGARRAAGDDGAGAARRGAGHRAGHRARGVSRRRRLMRAGAEHPRPPSPAPPGC